MNNSLTTIRDLVYQSRYTESIRHIKNMPYKEIGLPYIKNHSGNLNSIRKTFWLDDGYGYNRGWGQRPVGFNRNGWSWGIGYGYMDGSGSNLGCDRAQWGRGYAYGAFRGQGYGAFNSAYCPWLKNS